MMNLPHYFSALKQLTTAQRELLAKTRLANNLVLVKKAGQIAEVIAEGFYLIYRHELHKAPNHPRNTKYIQYFCQRMLKVFNVQVHLHGQMPDQTALWVSNHVSWMDVMVMGAAARVFFLAKAEVRDWPVLGLLTRSVGTLYIRRGSGDSPKIQQQITGFLQQDIPVLFYPEGTTSDGTRVGKVHGRLLGAAIEANKPVQVVLICYINSSGQLDQVVPYYGQQTMVDSVFRILQMPLVTAHVLALPPIDPSGHTVESLTAQVADTMQAGLSKLQHMALNPQQD